MEQPTVADWIVALRSYLGVPFRHQGRSRHGLDCTGLLVCAAADVGICEGADKVRGYARTPNSSLFDQWCERLLTNKPYNRLQQPDMQLDVGDVLTFWIDTPNVPRHLAVYTGKNSFGEDMMIHAYAQSRKVVEQPFNDIYWYTRMLKAYTPHELQK